ncbi:DUF4760 domain-containing protein [Legionella pneumophila]|uniref:DUF4760 domain-containing protein n=1 Tax=Legionella pneumophila TaxID=446 RepID=UPI001A24A831|nr:DUF4760 domain-containing protein [Legionella pneumophila]MCW8391320.1 DUF4760 domain-containing protein [Legionella pneumophila]MCW8430902.1 DUF4760 domain-containing protein [Legionella pneumophila]MCW8440341.1 DUF4760 domain-containing protein [Legionella pneumophila]MCZ4781742.1 DUF4760 domain-containing protein [Legionella pneumophila]MCZ4790814.1 DUF4760 domain-containing protein [Legionella pneumophila]
MNIVDTHQLKTNVLHLNAGIVIILTALIVCAGWLQFTNLNQTSKGDFLLRIDTRYSSDEILKARTLIHKFYCQTKDENITDDRHVELIGNKILEIKYEESEAENFIILINFLDFLETIAFFVRKDYVSPKEVHELIGGSIVYYFKVFKPWIFHRRLKRNNNNYYCEIEKLIGQLEG